MSLKIPAKLHSFEVNIPLREAAMRAISVIRDALENGTWMPSEDRDPDFRMDAIEAHAETDVPVFDLALCRDLVDISLGAMEAGEWADVDEEAIAAVQRFNYLTQLAEDLAPSQAEYQIGLAS